MRVCDFIANVLIEHNVKYVYGLMGGGASGLNDGFIKNDNIEYICFHHEQGAGFAACGEAKVSNNVAVVNPTTGCGGANAITALLDAWQDSLPVVFISGNVKKNQCSRYINSNKNINLRKYGIQEHDIIGTVQSLCKYSKFIESVNEVSESIYYALHIANQSRKGPVWIDIPADIQHAEMTIDQMQKYSFNNNVYECNFEIDNFLKSNRPLVLAGNGIHLSNTKDKFLNFIEKYNLPFVSTYLGIDLINFDHPLYLGTIGIKGSRAGNFSIQKCEALLILGCSLNNSHTGYDERLFSPNSYKIYVDIDYSELNKNIFNIDQKINIDLKDFFDYV